MNSRIFELSVFGFDLAGTCTQTYYVLGNGSIRLGINYSVSNEMKRDE
jgi:hypothetical protein